MKKLITFITGSALIGAPALMAQVDLTTAGTASVTAANDGAAAALPIFIALVAIAVGVMGFKKLQRG